MHVKIFTKKNCIVLLSILLSLEGYTQTADFTYVSQDSSHCAPYRVVFIQSCSGNPIGFIWDFGNGQKGSNTAEVCIYNTAGTYTVSLTAIYANSAVSITKTITVNATPTVLLTADKNKLCKPDAVTFTATGSPFISNYEWSFGDESTARNPSLNTVTHAYRNYGNYTSTVKAFAASGCNASASYDISIAKVGIAAAMSADSGCIPVSKTLSVSASLPAGDRALNYAWNFGDGTAVSNTTDSSIVHLYNTTDSINNATVTVNTAQGCSNQVTFQPFAFGTPPAGMMLSTALMTDSFCGSQTIKFNGRATNANAYTWNFGDSTSFSSIDTFITHKYQSIGKQQIIATSFFNGCKGTSDTINIFIKGVIAAVNYSNACNDKKTYQFINASKGNITHHQWEFSDSPGIKDTVNSNTSHSFPVSGSFKASLSLADNTTGCTDTVSYDIYTAVPLFSSSSNSVCKDSLVTYTVSNSFPIIAGYNYEFHVNGDTVMNGSDSILNFHPNRHGSFTDYVVIKDAIAGTCDDTLQLNNIIVKGPVADFTAPFRMCTGKTVSFSSNSHPYYPADAITKWEWNFGDSTYSTAENPLPHLYPHPGFFTINYIATDKNGCAQTMQKEVLMDRLPQISVFPAMDTICRGRDTSILRAYTIDTLLWLPSTSISCTSCDSTHVFPAVTTTYIARAKNWIGCLSYDTAIVKVYGPADLKVFPADTAICPGKTISYRLNVNGITSWLPATGLNSTSIKNPVATPLEDITYTAIVKDSAGCFTDTAFANVHVFPLPAVNAGPDQLLSYNSSFTITPVYSADVASYTWTPATNLSCSNCDAPSGTALQTTTYTVKTTSVNGCTSSDNINIVIACENGNLLLPTAFSPNGNGINEYFYPIARGYKTIRKMVIFNRRGNKVFERQNFAPNIRSMGWDGRINNADNVADSETFAWYIEAECEQGQLVTNKGTVVLIR